MEWRKEMNLAEMVWFIYEPGIYDYEQKGGDLDEEA